jgi:hypothetical protein
MTHKLVLVVCVLLVGGYSGFCQVRVQRKVNVAGGKQVVLRDTTYTTTADTVIWLSDAEAESLRIKDNPYETSSTFYDSLEDIASANKVTDNIFDFIVKKKGSTRKIKEVSPIIKSEEIFERYAGYTIGSISFKGVDLLEGSVIDTLKTASTRVGQFVNKVHKDTRPFIIKQNLLFKVGDLVDPFRLADNERLLREFKTLRDARIYLKARKGGSKVVDVVVVTQDVASIGVAGDYSSLQDFRLDVYDINMLGYAKQLQVSFFRNTDETPHNGYEITLREQNLFRTFIQGEFQYTENYLRRRTRLELGRDFFTPEIKYAGGLELYRTHEKFFFEEYDTIETPYTANGADLWGGRSIEIQKRINLIITGRLNTQRFIERPFVSSDSNSFFYDRTLLLAGVTLTKRNYLKSQRIRGFGRTEDIPIGGSFGLLAGKEYNEFIDRYYAEVNVTQGRYFGRLGYIQASVTGGSYFRSTTAEDGVVKIGVTYFSDLVKARRSQVRQFLYYSYTLGLNRILDRSVALQGRWYDQNGFRPLGNERMTLGFETVYFMPWYVYGFQFALFHRLDLNLLSRHGKLFARSSFFPAAQIGVRILNEHLVLPRFSFKLGYYGKNAEYSAKWEIKVTTTLPNLFRTSQYFKPVVAAFE